MGVPAIAMGYNTSIDRAVALKFLKIGSGFFFVFFEANGENEILFFMGGGL